MVSKKGGKLPKAGLQSHVIGNPSGGNDSDEQVRSATVWTESQAFGYFRAKQGEEDQTWQATEPLCAIALDIFSICSIPASMVSGKQSA